MNKQRHISDIIRQRSQTSIGRIIIITGARQVGKTTIVQNKFPDYKYLAVEDPMVKLNIKQFGTQQWNRIYPKAALDEVQKEPDLIESIKATYDIYGDVRYILLGSSQILLLQKVKESLAGRCSIFQVFPLCITELESPQIPLHNSKWQKALLGEQPEIEFSLTMHENYAAILDAYDFYLKFGGYPALVDDSLNDDLKYEWLKDYAKTYLERDLADLAAIKDLKPFVKLRQALALQTGNVLVVSNLSRDLDVSIPTINRYIEYLSISYQTVSLQAWSKNVQKRLSKSPKIHFLDHGVLQAVLQRRGGMSGNEYESAIVSEIYKQAYSVNADVRFYHLRTHEGKEVDLVVETPQGYYMFEIKMAENVTVADTRHLRNIEEIVNDKPILHKYILSNDMQTKEFGNNITAVHAALFLG